MDIRGSLRAQEWANARDEEAARRAEMSPKIQAAGEKIAERLSAETGLHVAFEDGGFVIVLDQEEAAR